ncbi:hypothetical protein H257_16710 [Aphanomyces astaci]|uniref:Uncharacterized protein n=1 Tax=Aphanomyces astaci TaxID=112090 RepID=W4FHA0_APHAT|nr:hypothetical protein H257_16710 [Aphanomyces astaci]ETV66897.1 hypothetical protein H257_16710 [Aphanomyces astaci]|eukprot:XP_009843538.1 hypothetical protein H257_16710 [Aphanomyces astaci]
MIATELQAVANSRRGDHFDALQFVHHAPKPRNADLSAAAPFLPLCMRCLAHKLQASPPPVYSSLLHGY